VTEAQLFGAAGILATVSGIAVAVAIFAGQPHRRWWFVGAGVMAVIALGLAGTGAFDSPPQDTHVSGEIDSPDTSSTTSRSTSLSPPTTSSSAPTTPPPAAATTALNTYLDVYYSNCRFSPSSIQRTGPATIAGKPYGHTLSQTANGFTTYFQFAVPVTHFESVVGLVAGSALQDQQVQFEVVGVLAGGGEKQLYISEVICQGGIDQVDVPLDGVISLGLRAIPVGNGGGPQGSAGWGDAQVTAPEPLQCL